jgi:hypothetical protein
MFLTATLVICKYQCKITDTLQLSSTDGKNVTRPPRMTDRSVPTFRKSLLTTSRQARKESGLMNGHSLTEWQLLWWYRQQFLAKCGYNSTTSHDVISPTTDILENVVVLHSERRTIPGLGVFVVFISYSSLILKESLRLANFLIPLLWGPQIFEMSICRQKILNAKAVT